MIGPILAVDISAHGAGALLDQSGGLIDVVDLPTLEAGPAGTTRPRDDELAAPADVLPREVGTVGIQGVSER